MKKTKRKMPKSANKGKVQIRRPQTLVDSVEKAMQLIDSDEAATMIENQPEAGVIAKAVTDTWRLLFQVLVTDKRIRNHEANRETFAKGQLLNANLIQVAFACGMRAGEKHAEDMTDLTAMSRPVGMDDD
jgi:hypothetical protein